MATLIKSNDFSLPSVIAEPESMDISSVIYDIKPSDSYEYLYFQDGHCICISSGLTKVLMNRTGTFHFTKVSGYYDLWHLESVEYW